MLNVGSGPQSPQRLHAVFRDARRWQETRLDVDSAVKPDILCSVVDMQGVVPDASVDAIWSSHNIEHLHDHEVPLALAEYRRVLKPDGFLLLRCPDIESVAQAILKIGLDAVAYVSPAGPITPLDMLYGHRASIAAGSAHMRHHTGFTDVRFGQLLLEAGFASVHTLRDGGYDLWALAFREDADVKAGLALLAAHGTNFHE